MEHERVPVLWFDSCGCGPDQFYLERVDFPADKGGKIPAWMGLRVRAGATVIVGAPLIDGGFNLGREQVEALHRMLGGWLEKTAPAEPSSPDVFL